MQSTHKVAPVAPFKDYSNLSSACLNCYSKLLNLRYAEKRSIEKLRVKYLVQLICQRRVTQTGKRTVEVMS